MSTICRFFLLTVEKFLCQFQQGVGIWFNKGQDIVNVTCERSPLGWYCGVDCSALESSAVAVLRLLSNLGAIVALHMLVVFVIFRGAALHSDLINQFWFGCAHKKFHAIFTFVKIYGKR